MGELFLQFWSFRDPNVVWVLLGAVILGATAGGIGTFAFVRKRSLAGDALAHAALPGVTTAFVLAQSRDPSVIIIGAFVSCFLGFFSIEYLIHRTKVKEDSALAMVLSFFFALGVFHLSYIQKLPITGQSGLDKLLFGQAASLVRRDVMVLGMIGTVILIVTAALFHKFKAVSFDPAFARAVGVRVRSYEALLAVLIVLAVVIGLQLVGVVLMAALLMTPPAAARYWSRDLRVIVALSSLFGAASGVFGANISYLAPRMPTGPWIVVGITLIFTVSLFFAPEQGVLAAYRRRLRIRSRIAQENVLRTIFKIGEASRHRAGVEPAEILRERSMDIRVLERSLAAAARSGLLNESEGRYRLTPEGYGKAAEITRFHRLWELYLSRNLHIASDHVHDDAEFIEHILTPELERKLSAELDSPGTDPHGQKIPDIRGDDA
jgi:manganese/zinc/iron transport system permease protein